MPLCDLCCREQDSSTLPLELPGGLEVRIIFGCRREHETLQVREVLAHKAQEALEFSLFETAGFDNFWHSDFQLSYPAGIDFTESGKDAVVVERGVFDRNESVLAIQNLGSFFVDEAIDIQESQRPTGHRMRLVFVLLHLHPFLPSPDVFWSSFEVCA